MIFAHVVPTYAPAWRYGGPIRSVHAVVVQTEVLCEQVSNTVANFTVTASVV